MIEQILIGLLLIEMIRQRILYTRLEKKVWNNEKLFWSLAAQTRGLAHTMGYTIVLNEGDDDGISSSTKAV